MTNSPSFSHDLADWFGQIDIYLFDQILRGRVAPGTPILDAGCGRGRNCVFFLRNGYDIHGVDSDRAAVVSTRALANRLAGWTAAERFRVADLDALPFRDGHFGFVIASAVLHFAKNRSAFDASLDELWRVIRREGVLFVRTASTVGVEDLIQPLGHGRYHLPDGTDRFLVDEATLLERTRRMGGSLLDPIKTTVVQRQRAMTTWIVRKDR